MAEMRHQLSQIQPTSPSAQVDKVFLWFPFSYEICMWKWLWGLFDTHGKIENLQTEFFVWKVSEMMVNSRSTTSCRIPSGSRREEYSRLVQHSCDKSSVVVITDVSTLNLDSHRCLLVQKHFLLQNSATAASRLNENHDAYVTTVLPKVNVHFSNK